jgi:hypothetical protein
MARVTPPAPSPDLLTRRLSLVQITTDEHNTKHAQDISIVRRRSMKPAAVATPRHEATAQPLDHGRGPCSC